MLLALAGCAAGAASAAADQKGPEVDTNADLSAIALALHFQGTEAEKRKQADEFAKLAHGAYALRQAGVPAALLESEEERRKQPGYKEPPSLPSKPWEIAKLYKEKHGGVHPLVPVLQQRHHWEARAYETNRRRAHEAFSKPATPHFFNYWTQRHPKPKPKPKVEG